MKKLLTFSIAFMLAVLFNTNAIAQVLTEYECSPQQGEVTIEQMSNLVLTFPNAAGKTLTTGFSGNRVMFYVYDQTTGKQIGTNRPGYLEGNKVTLTDTETNPGQYRYYMRKNHLRLIYIIQFCPIHSL